MRGGSENHFQIGSTFALQGILSAQEPEPEFKSREKTFDWSATIYEGGIGRGFLKSFTHSVDKRARVSRAILWSRRVMVMDGAPS